MPIKTFPWNAADHLESEEMILAYLEAAFEYGHLDLIAAALSNVTRARGVADPR
jgi:DNA-binding phage protein